MTWKKGESGNPRGRPRKDQAETTPAISTATPAAAWSERKDSWENLITGIGSTTYDKRVYSTWSAGSSRVTDQEAADLWAANPMAARIIETWPNEMTRGGFDLVIAEDDTPPEESDTAPPQAAAPAPFAKKPRTDLFGEEGEEAEVENPGPEYAAKSARFPIGTKPKVAKPKLQDQVTARMEELDVIGALWTALAYERAYGGDSAILLGVDDGATDLAQPLDLENIKSLDWLTVLEPCEIQPRYWYADPRAPKFGEPSHYQIGAQAPGPSEKGDNPSKLEIVHESRLLIFPGIRVSRMYRQADRRGDSILTRVRNILRDHGMGFDAAAILLNDFAQPVYKIKGLAEAVAQDAEAEIATRMRATERARSTIRAVLVDSEEEFKREQTPMNGLSDILDRLSTMLAAAADMPLTLLMGVSPGGLNATGESDIRFFYDRVKAAQVRKLKPALEKIAQILILTFGTEPEQWCVEFRPLWQQSEKEMAEARNLQAQTDQIYVDMMAVSPEDIARSRFGGVGNPFDTKVDFEKRALMEEEAKAAEEMAMQQSIESAKAAGGEESDGPPEDFE